MSIRTATLVSPTRMKRAAASPPTASGIPLPILSGALAGYWWIPASGGKVARMLLGTYEPEQTALFRRYITPGSSVLDVGAAGGYYTLLAARLAGKNGQVVSLEPDPRNAAYLRRHIELNRLRTVTVQECAAGAEAGHFHFGGGQGTGTGRLCDEGERLVRVRLLDQLVRDLALAPTHVKIDVEGAEHEVLLGARDTIGECRPIFFLSTHGPEVHALCCQLLSQWNYALSPIIGESMETTTEVLAIPR